jgi:uncharacterized protein (DUF1697 family)
MPRYVAFLRAINVGGHVVKMEILRAMFESMKFKSVETFIASGNVIFETNLNVTDIRPKIEDRLRKALGYEVATFLRSDAEVGRIACYKPFPEPSVASSPTFCVGFLGAPLSAEAARRAMGFKTEDDDFHVHGSELYWLSRLRQSESTFSNSAFEKALGIRATFRGMNTIRRLAAKYPPSEDVKGR